MTAVEDSAFVEQMFGKDQFRTWTKGMVENPLWLQRQNGHDYCVLKTERDVEDFGKYLSGDVAKLSCEPYNQYTTGRDANNSPMIVLRDMGPGGQYRKCAIIIISDIRLARRILQLVEHYMEDMKEL